MNIIAFARIFIDYYNFPDLTDYERKDLERKKKRKSIRIKFYEEAPERYYARRQHDKYDTDRQTRICQKGLAERVINKKRKEQEAGEERRIQEAFSRKTKSRRWAKRHHDWRFYGFPDWCLFIRRNYPV